MLVLGDDALAHRLARELAEVYRRDVVLVAPGAGSAPAGPDRVRHVTGTAPDEETLLRAGLRDAEALALLYEDDEANMRAAFLARRLAPDVRLVLRMYNRNLGHRMADLLDRAGEQPAAAGAFAGAVPRDATTIVLSDADTAAPTLAATAVAGTRKAVQADGVLLRAAERLPEDPDALAEPGLATLALLSSTSSDPAGADGSDRSGGLAPLLLPDDAEVRAAAGRGAVVLEAIGREPRLPRRRGSRGASPRELLSPRLRRALAGVVAGVTALTVAAVLATGAHPLHAAYLTLLDLFAIGDPAVGEETARQVLQLLAGLLGLALLPLLIAGTLEALGAYRSAAALRRPPRGLDDHVVLLGLGRIGTRVLVRLRELGVPVVCVEEDPEARGIPHARRLRVPVVLGDVTQEGVLEAAKVHRAHALLALTSSDTTNLEAVLAARTLAPDLLVALRLYDDDFATTVYRTLRAAHPGALTRSRSVTTLSAPAFAAAMMGRQILGAIPVERRVLLFAAVEVAGLPGLEGRTVAEAFRPGAWRVLALDTGGGQGDGRSAEGGAGAAEPPALLWELHPGYVLRPGDRVVVAATRAGLPELLGGAGGPAPAPPPPPDPAPDPAPDPDPDPDASPSPPDVGPSA
ncbi:NAD-binding protein [Streptomyces omiyaensis]|uniref:NAD-binding protein n=1 Tax=Streptomyces omiyaensis TaxID=68247 RepID=A0ABW7BQG1_9ACTN